MVDPSDPIRELLDRHGDRAAALDGELRKLYREGQISAALVAIARAFDSVAAEARSGKSRNSD